MRMRIDELKRRSDQRAKDKHREGISNGGVSTARDISDMLDRDKR